MKKYIAYLFLLPLLFACGTEQTAEEQTPPPRGIPHESLYGIWEGVSFHINVNSFENKPDSSFVFEVSEGDWEQKLQVKPVRTIYLPDSTYVQEFRGLKGEIYESNKGLWRTLGDTLLLLERDAQYLYDSRIADNGLLWLRSLVDWDGDGQEDDEYLAAHRLVGRDVRVYQAR